MLSYYHCCTDFFKLFEGTFVLICISEHFPHLRFQQVKEMFITAFTPTSCTWGWFVARALGMSLGWFVARALGMSLFTSGLSMLI